jgi:hypothetical protein
VSQLGWTPLERGGLGCVANRGTVARQKSRVASFSLWVGIGGPTLMARNKPLVVGDETVQLDAPGLKVSAARARRALLDS